MSDEKRKPTPEEKAKAAAEARAEAEAVRKLREHEAAGEASSADAKGAEAAADSSEQAAETPAPPSKPVSEMTPEEKAAAKAAAAAKAKAAAAAKVKAVQGGDGAGAAEEAPKAPSKNQPFLDKYVFRITEAFGADTLEASYINELAKDVPTLVVKKERWLEVAPFLKEDEQLGFDYLSDLHGVDYEDRMEVYYHFYSYKNRQSVAIKVKTDREQPTVPSVMDIWHGADWNEREAFDLLGIHFPGHRDMRRILLPDDWVGFPLRKDYVQYDEEV